MHHPLRLTLDRSAIQSNWRWLADYAGVAAGAAVKADGYGLGAREVTEALVAAGCRDFFVSTWSEAEALGDLPEAVSLVVLHGVGPGRRRRIAGAPRSAMSQFARAGRAVEGDFGRTLLRRDDRYRHEPAWPSAHGDRGARRAPIETLHSHLACADEHTPMNAMQLERFRAVAAAVPAKRYAFANSAGIGLGKDYSFDLVRPGISIYGGVQRPEFEGPYLQVARVEAQIVQRRLIPRGRELRLRQRPSLRRRTLKRRFSTLAMRTAICVDFPRAGSAFAGEFSLPVLGRVSMDLIAVERCFIPGLSEGDWVEIDYDLPSASSQSGLSQYELLTTLGSRFERRWV